ncbi:hypothetical protein Ae201684P_018036 [Aphanomyces euteiches]|nr:hypothetical protein Ae201684P_018036 [Aphanomyces euteiches]
MDIPRQHDLASSSLALPSLRAETHEALDVVNVEINTSVPFDTIAFIRLNNVSLDVSDQLIVTFWNAFNFATPSCVTAYVVRSATNYPAMHLVDVLTPEGSWTVPSMSSTGERNESRLTAQVSMAIQMPPSYVGLTQYAIQATWENAPSDPLPVLGVPSPTQLSIGSIRPDSLVPFNTSGTIELSDVAVGMSDAVTIHVRIDSPAVAKSVAVFVVQTVDNYPPMHYLNASSGNGTFMLPRLVLSTTQNLTRALSSVSISIQMAHYFVGSISYTVRLSTQPSQTQYLYRGNMTWQSKVAALVPPIHPAVVTPLAIGSVQVDEVVAFNSSGTLELSNIPLDISDQLQVDVRVLDPLASNVITTLARRGIDGHVSVGVLAGGVGPRNVDVACQSSAGPLTSSTLKSNTSVPFDTIAFIRLNNVSLDVSDQLIVTFWNAFNFATPSCVTAYVVRSATNYPAMHLVDVLTPEGSWTVPSMSSTGERNESRLTAQVSMAIQMPPSYVGLTQYAIQVTQRPSSRTSVLNWMYRVKATWENAPSDPLPVLGVPSPTQLSIGSIRPDSLVPFNTSGTIELSDVAVGMSDAVTIHVRIDSPAVAKSVAVFVVQTVDNYPPMHYLNASSGNGTFMLPRLVLSTTQNLTRALSSVSISIQMAHYFVGSISYTVRLSTQPSQTQYLYRGNMTWQSKVAALVPPIHPAVVTPLAIGSVQVDEVVAFNSSGTLELSNIPLDISDQLQVDVRVLDPLASNVITTLLAVESMTCIRRVLPAYQNVTRVIDSLSVSFELGELFVGTMQYALRVSVLKPNNMSSQWTYQGNMTWLPPSLALPSLRAETHEALDVVNVEINTSVPFDTIAFIRLNNVSLDVSDQLIVTFWNAFNFATPSCVTAYVVRSATNYPAMHLVDVLTPEGSWTCRPLSMAIQMPPSYVGLTQYAIQVTQRPSSRTSVLNWMYRVKATWENAPSDPLPVLGVPSPTQLSIGSIRPDSLVPFNTSGTIELSDVAVGMSDAVTIHVRIDSPAVAKSVAVFVVQTVDNYPPMHYLNASSGNGTFMLPRLVLSTTQNLTRALVVGLDIDPDGALLCRTQYLYRGNMTWQSKVAALVPPIHPAVVTPLAIGSVQVDEVVAFNSSGTLELSNIPLDISDQLQVDVRVLDPLASNVITTLLAVESMDMYPSGYWPVVLDQGTWTLPAKVLPAYQNVTRVIDSLSVSFELGELFVGTMQYALRVQHDLASSFFGSSIPSCGDHEALDVVNVEINTSVPFDTIAFIRLNNVSLDVSDQLIVTFWNAFNFATPSCVTAYVVRSATNYPAMHLVDVLTPEGSWTVPSMSSTGERNESRLTAQVSMAIQMPPSYVGLTQYAIQVTQRPSSRTFRTELDVSSQGDVENAPSDPLPVLGVPSPTQLSIGSIRPDSLVPFNTSGTIELSDVASCRGEICGRVCGPNRGQLPTDALLECLVGKWHVHVASSRVVHDAKSDPCVVVGLDIDPDGALLCRVHLVHGPLVDPAIADSISLSWKYDVAVQGGGTRATDPSSGGHSPGHRSVQVDEVVAFNSSGTLELSNIPLDISDQLQVDVRVLDPLASNVITNLARRGIDGHVSVGVLAVLPAYQNVTRVIDSLSVSFELGELFVGTMQYALRVSVLKPNNMSSQWTYQGNMTWLPPSLALPSLRAETHEALDVVNVEINTSVRSTRSRSFASTMFRWTCRTN